MQCAVVHLLVPAPPYRLCLEQHYPFVLDPPCHPELIPLRHPPLVERWTFEEMLYSFISGPQLGVLHLLTCVSGAGHPRSNREVPSL